MSYLFVIPFEKQAGFKDIVIDHFSIKGQMENKYDYSIFKFIFSLKVVEIHMINSSIILTSLTFFTQEKLKLPKKMDLDET